VMRASRDMRSAYGTMTNLSRGDTASGLTKHS
jgi:hypothetical protein